MTSTRHSASGANPAWRRETLPERGRDWLEVDSVQSARTHLAGWRKWLDLPIAERELRQPSARTTGQASGERVPLRAWEKEVGGSSVEELAGLQPQPQLPPASTEGQPQPLQIERQVSQPDAAVQPPSSASKRGS